MPIYKNNGDHLFVELHEPYTLTLFLSTIQEIGEYCQKEKLNKVLVDLLKVTGNPSILDRYHFGVEIARVWGPRIKAAAIAEPSLVNFMAETVAVNRGANFKVFFDRDKASTWLGLELS
jgi:hypothetical protein